MVVCRTSEPLDRAVGEVAGRQRGLITRSQLLGLGLTRHRIDHWRSRGKLITIHRGVYALSHLALPEHAAELAAVLAIGRGALLSHGSAAALWGLTTERGRRDIEVTVVGRDAGRRRPGIAVHQAGDLHPSDAAVREGIPITSAVRTLADIAPALDSRELERAFDRGLKGRVLTRAAVNATLSRSPRPPGTAHLSVLVADELRTPKETRSEREERFLRLVRAGGLPEPELNVRIGPYRVDALWRTLRLVVEVDGYEFHSTRRSFENDRERDLQLTSQGFSTIRFTAEQVKDRPAMVLVRLAQQLSALEAQRGRSNRNVS
ncbi:MAG: DUF559 domain-containing protein [Solirubrobacteraceae bacterium]